MKTLELNINLCDDMMSGKIRSEVRSKDLSVHASDCVQFVPVKRCKDGSVVPAIHPISNMPFTIERIIMGRGLADNAAMFIYRKLSSSEKREYTK